MIQFRQPYSPGSDHDFFISCPVCGLGELRIRYRYEPEAYIDRHSNRGECFDARIIEQDCTCLVGDDAAEDALDVYLERPRRSLRSTE